MRTIVLLATWIVHSLSMCENMVLRMWSSAGESFDGRGLSKLAGIEFRAMRAVLLSASINVVAHVKRSASSPSCDICMCVCG